MESFSCLRPKNEPVGDNERTLKAFLCFAFGAGVGEAVRCCCESKDPARILRFMRPAVSCDAEGLRFFLKLLSESESLAGIDGGGSLFASLALAEGCSLGKGPS